MAKRVDPDAIATVLRLLVDYYESGKRIHTFDSIAKRARVSRSTVARLARQVRKVLPTVSDLLKRIEALEQRVAALETTDVTDIVEKRRTKWAS
jgi:predicted nuclease with TOPRIM domain